jgi:hypothetical protein
MSSLNTSEYFQMGLFNVHLRLLLPKAEVLEAASWTVG